MDHQSKAEVVFQHCYYLKRFSIFSKSEHIVPRCLFVMYLFPKGTCICRTHRIRIYWYSYPFCQFILVASSNMPSPRVRNGLLKIEKLSNGKTSTVCLDKDTFKYSLFNIHTSQLFSKTTPKLRSIVLNRSCNASQHTLLHWE